MNHRKILVLILFAFVVNSVRSQTIEITPSYGYQFGTKLNYGPNYIKLDDSDQFGLALGYELDSGLMGEITYLRHSSQLNIRDVIIGPGERRLADVNADWFFLGASKYFKTGKVKPFAGAGLGLLFLTPENENLDLLNRRLNNQTKFSLAFKTGVNIMFSEVVGLNLQFNLLLPVDWGGFVISGGSGGVSGGVGVSSSTIVAGFSGGLVFRLGDI